MHLFAIFVRHDLIKRYQAVGHETVPETEQPFVLQTDHKQGIFHFLVLFGQTSENKN
jgi:hypothetical protein